MNAHCAVCLKPTKKSNNDAHCFCSVDCFSLFYNQKVVTFTCESCKIQFDTLPSYQHRWCSWSCYINHVTLTKSFADSFSLSKFTSNKNKSDFQLYDLAYLNESELQRMYHLEQDESIESWKRSTYKVEYTDINGTQQFYTPDFEIKYKNGVQVIEDIRGYSDENSRIRLSVAKNYFVSMNLDFRVLNRQHKFQFEPCNSVYINDYGKWTRPTFEHIFMSMATEMRNRSTCVRKQVGAVFVDPEFTRVLCFGYNGGISGDHNQCESLLPGACGCTHAEINATTKSNETLKGSILFVTTAPCKACAAVLINRGVSKVYYLNTYRDDVGLQKLKSRNIEVCKWSDFVEDRNRILI